MTQATDSEKRKGVYRGPLPLLKGKTASLICYPSEQCLAKFDDVETGYGTTFHNFSTMHFELDRAIDWNEGQGLV